MSGSEGLRVSGSQGLRVKVESPKKDLDIASFPKKCSHQIKIIKQQHSTNVDSCREWPWVPQVLAGNGEPF